MPRITIYGPDPHDHSHSLVHNIRDMDGEESNHNKNNCKFPIWDTLEGLVIAFRNSITTDKLFCRKRINYNIIRLLYYYLLHISYLFLVKRISFLSYQPSFSVGTRNVRTLKIWLNCSMDCMRGFPSTKDLLLSRSYILTYYNVLRGVTLKNVPVINMPISIHVPMHRILG